MDDRPLVISTAMGLRRHLAKYTVNEDELRFIFRHMPLTEQREFFDMFGNPDVRDIDTFLGFLKIVKAL